MSSPPPKRPRRAAPSDGESVQLSIAARSLECPVCLLCYDAADRKPLGLPCGHGLCSVCHRAASAVVNGFSDCPTCKTPIGDTVSLNYALLQVLESVEALSLCAECGERGPQRHQHACEACDDGGTKLLCCHCALAKHPGHRLRSFAELLEAEKEREQELNDLTDDAKLNRDLLPSDSVRTAVKSVKSAGIERFYEKLEKRREKLLRRVVELVRRLAYWASVPAQKRLASAESRAEYEELAKKLKKASAHFATLAEALNDLESAAEAAERLHKAIKDFDRDADD